MIREYDKSDPISILNYGQKLIGKSLRELIGEDTTYAYKGKGKLGQLVEEAYFGYKPNSIAGPDFEEAGVELKTTPLKISTRKGVWVAKERLVISMIDYMREHMLSFETSSFLQKSAQMLLLFYIHDKDKVDFDLRFQYVTLWKFPKKDLEIIKDDWEKIVTKIKAGKAHELSEGDTFYLGACTKGADSSKRRKQPFSNEPAKPRAFALKQSYMNQIINAIRGEDESTQLIKDINELKMISFEDAVLNKFVPFTGMTYEEICKTQGIETSQSKSRYYYLSLAMLGVFNKNKIEEFEKAGVILKTIRLENNDTIKEHMSFENIDFCTILDEEWESSFLFYKFTKRFLFVVYKADAGGIYRFSGSFFWTMPSKDLEVAESFWKDTKDKIMMEDYEHFMRTKDDKLCHVRPKAKNKNDLTNSHTGKPIEKKCYWLNKSYIESIVNENLNK